MRAVGRASGRGRRSGRGGAPGRRLKGSGHEPLGGQVRAAEVAAGEADAADVAARRGRRSGPAGGGDRARRSWRWRSAGRSAGAAASRRRRPTSGKAVTTWLSVGPYWLTSVQSGCAREEPSDRVGDLELLAGGDDLPQRGDGDAEILCGLAEVLQRHEGQEQPLDPLLGEVGEQRLRITADLLVEQDERPAGRAGSRTVSWKATSKLSEANCRVRAGSRARPSSRRCQASRLASGRCAIATPFGCPVDPEV